MPGGQPLIPSRGRFRVCVGASHKASMLGNQTHVPCVGVGVCPSAPMPGSHPLPSSGVNHMDPDQSYEDEEDVAPNQTGVSPFLHLIGQGEAPAPFFSHTLRWWPGYRKTSI
ncbi:hypothetical protein E2C01_056937 [Portunus trituberculatus]|uniref:Uncharacterized protein n=1 Tax=Portunus trituberculatus TaxID=210409 RepID=A0A5B7H0H3_PORTR|nr:hypothetical protein [Portunus trituberculatus]